MNTLAEIKNFIFIDQFIFASNLTKLIHNRFNFESITSIPCREPYKREKTEVFIKNYKKEGDKLDDNIMKIVIHDLLESIQIIDKEVKPYPEYVFGVLGPKQYNFFQSVLPENKIVDVTRYKTISSNTGESEEQSIKNIYHLVCRNSKDAFFHTSRISTFVSIVHDLCAYNLPYRLKDLMVIPVPSTKYFTESKFLSENPKYSENENPNFHFLDAIFSLKYFMHAIHLPPPVENITKGDKKIKIFLTKIYHWNENNVNHLILEGLDAVKFLIFFAENIARQTPIGHKPVFAVLGKDQMSFFVELFRECKYTDNNLYSEVKIMDISQYIPDEMDYVCRDRKMYLDYEYHARRINIIQNYFKEHVVCSKN